MNAFKLVEAYFKLVGRAVKNSGSHSFPGLLLLISTTRGVASISQRGVLNSADAFSADKNSLPKAAFGYFQLYTPFIV